MVWYATPLQKSRIHRKQQGREALIGKKVFVRPNDDDFLLVGRENRNAVIGTRPHYGMVVVVVRSFVGLRGPQTGACQDAIISTRAKLN